MKDLNKELSQKLEVQTQRLELLTSQSMVSSDNIPQRKPGPRTVVDNTPYADEGDEVKRTIPSVITKIMLHHTFRWRFLPIYLFGSIRLCFMFNGSNDKN